MIGAGGDQIHAIDLRAQAVVGKTMNDRQGRHTARAEQAHTGEIGQQTGRIAGRGPGGLDLFRGKFLGPGRYGRRFGRGDLNRRQFGCGKRRQWGGGNQNRERF
ncbi:MAG: hypothetical protein B7X37_02800 [Halothiobacillus sp. 14-55-98]|nr:MAG: hypothetical protein B7X37_02800 [Halothiobacillus sp. 14-55-98]